MIDPETAFDTPLDRLIEAVEELLYNREHLDLHPEDRDLLELRLNDAKAEAGGYQ